SIFHNFVLKMIENCYLLRLTRDFLQKCKMPMGIKISVLIITYMDKFVSPQRYRTLLKLYKKISRSSINIGDSEVFPFPKKNHPLRAKYDNNFRNNNSTLYGGRIITNKYQKICCSIQILALMITNVIFHFVDNNCMYNVYVSNSNLCCVINKKMKNNRLPTQYYNQNRMERSRNKTFEVAGQLEVYEPMLLAICLHQISYLTKVLPIDLTSVDVIQPNTLLQQIEHSMTLLDDLDLAARLSCSSITSACSNNLNLLAKNLFLISKKFPLPTSILKVKPPSAMLNMNFLVILSSLSFSVPMPAATLALSASSNNFFLASSSACNAFADASAAFFSSYKIRNVSDVATELLSFCSVDEISDCSTLTTLSLSCVLSFSGVFSSVVVSSGVSILADNSFSILTGGLSLSVLSSDLISIGLSSAVAGICTTFGLLSVSTSVFSETVVVGVEASERGTGVELVDASAALIV
ncbi:hypothetical protein AGLY_006714, partial [Aphis glycines]